MSNGLSLTDDIAATLQARLSWPQADGCAADVVAMFGRRMRNCPLTCEYCRNDPATHLLVFHPAGERRSALVCGDCGQRNLPRAHEIARPATAAWLFVLLPAGD